MSRRRLGLAVLAVLAVGVAVRAATLYWSPLPATLDGFRYAALARDAATTGVLPLGRTDADELVFTGLVTATSQVTGVRPLHVAQPLVACVGAASVLGAVAVARRLVPSSWGGHRVRTVVLVVGLSLAVEGLYVRRSGVPDEEAAALLFVPLVGLAVHRAFVTRRARWVALAGLLVAVLPPLHNFSAAIAALTVTALAAAHLARDPSRETVGFAAAATLGSWAYLVGFFAVADRFGLRLTYTGLLTEHLGVFVAWIVLVAVFAAWLGTTTDRVRRSVAALAVLPGFLVVGANLLVPVFPGTVRTPALVLALVVPLAVPALLFVLGAGRLSRGHGALALALAAGPVAMVWYALTTSPTVQFWDALLRAQTFAHAAIFAVAGVAAVGLGSRRPSLGTAAVAVLLLAAVVSAPLAFVHLDTGTYPRTVGESEFAASSFATTHADRFAADHRLGRAGPHYHADGAEAAILPTRTWLTGGPPPACPTLAQTSWATDGAHFFPTAPATVDTDELADWRVRNDLVYAVGGRTTTTLVVPRGGADSDC